MIKSLLPALLIALFACACAKPKDLEYVDFQNIQVLQVGLQESSVGMDIRLFNPNRQQIQLRKADVDVYINNQFLGKTSLDTLIQIPKRDTFSIPVVLKIGTLSAATNLLQYLSDTSTLIRLEGNARFGKAGVFFNYPIKYEGRKKIVF